MAALGFDHLPAVDFYMAGGSRKGQADAADGRSVPQAGGKRAELAITAMAAMIPEVSTPLQLLVALSSLLHGRPEKSPWLAQGFVDPASGQLQPFSFTAKEKKAGKSAAVLDLPQAAVARLVAATGRKTEHGILLEGEGLGWFVQPDGGRRYVQNRLVFADISAVAKENPLALLLVTSGEKGGPQQKVVAGKKKKRRKKGRKARGQKSIGQLLEKELGRISLLHMVSIGTDGLLAQQQEYGNYQGENRFVLQEKELSQIRQKTTMAMPNLLGMSLRAALRRLQGLPVRLVIDGSGVVKEQQPAAGVVLKKDSLCRLVLR